MTCYKPAQITGTTEYSGVVKFIVENSPDYAIGQFILSKGDALGPESHENDETFFVINGTLTVEEVGKNKAHTIHTGEIFVMGKGEEHRATNLSDEPVFALWICGK